MYQSFPARHYNRSNNAMPVVKETCPPKNCEKKEEVKKCEIEVKKKENPILDIFSSLEIDDIIIIGILLMLLYEGVNDILLIAVLGIILFT